MNLSRKQLALIVAALLGVVLVVLILFISRSTNEDSADIRTDTQAVENDGNEPLTPNDEIEQENQDQVDNPRPDEGDPAKTPVTVVTEKPLIYTGYGHNQLKPLPQGQSTSTTCTTDPNVECRVVATKIGSGDVFTFDPMTTDAEGVARWTWTGGESLTSGTWELVATAGDKSSDKEIIYVE